MPPACAAVCLNIRFTSSRPARPYIAVPKEHIQDRHQIESHFIGCCQQSLLLLWLMETNRFASVNRSVPGTLFTKISQIQEKYFGYFVGLSVDQGHVDARIEASCRRSRSAVLEGTSARCQTSSNSLLEELAALSAGSSPSTQPLLLNSALDPPPSPAAHMSCSRGRAWARPALGLCCACPRAVLGL